MKNAAAGLGRPPEARVHELGGARRRPARLEPGDPGRLRRRPRRRRRRGRRRGQKGLDFFAELNKAGNFVPVIGKVAPLAQGATPIIIRWDYNALADRDTLKGNPPVEVVVPKSGVVAGVYVQAISAYAPHPNAAKLWMEYLYSDEGQLKWLKGYCHPIRFNDLVEERQGPAGALDKLPPAASYEAAVFPTLEEQEREGRGHQGRLGQRRRRQRPVRHSRPAVGPVSRRSAAGRPSVSPHRASAAPAPGPGSARLPFFVFALLFLILPTMLPDRRRVPEPGGQVHPRRTSPTSFTPSIRRLLDLDPVSLASALGGALIGFAVAWR